MLSVNAKKLSVPEEFDEVSSCSSLLLDPDDESVLVDPSENMYLQTSVGRCLQSAVTSMLERGLISSTQASEIHSKFCETVYRALEKNCSRVQANVCGTLSEYSSLPRRSILKVEDLRLTVNRCLITSSVGEVVLSNSFSS